MSVRPGKRELRTGSVLAGKYKLQKELGRGAAGVVWSAVNTATSRQVALKLLLQPEPRAAERLLREARAAGALKHPNVLDVYDVIVAEDGSPALVLELLEGQTLQELMFERGPLPQGEAAAIARDVARGLAIAHASGIVHRDLKPANIFLHRPGDDPPVVKVVDFGISKNLFADERTLTQTGMAVGSPSFMSPEQVRGEREVDGRTDLWALGVILYEMLTGKRLFDGRPHEVLKHVLVQPIKPIEEVVAGLDPALVRVVQGLLTREIDKRSSSAEEVADWLARIATTASARSELPTDRPPGRAGAPHDTAVIPLAGGSSVPPAKLSSIPPPKSAPPPPRPGVPRIHEDDDDDETTHVAPMAMRQALAKKSAPSIYSDDEEEEGDRTRVAGAGELSAGIQATRELPGAGAAGGSDENAVPTVRPAALPATAAPSDNPPSTKRAPAQVVSEHPPSSRRAASKQALSEKPPSGGAAWKQDVSDNPPSTKRAPGQPPAEKPPSSGGALKQALSEKPPSGGAASKQATSDRSPSSGGASKQALSDRSPSSGGASRQAFSEKPPSSGAAGAKPPTSEKPLSLRPVSEKPASDKPPAGGAPLRSAPLRKDTSAETAVHKVPQASTFRLVHVVLILVVLVLVGLIVAQRYSLIR